ncbi:MAG: DUF116 domain-containing protein [Theionarchaea archaeon]|nr:DUF116 domain-containing protein [Theionarchaea archaeon]MBU7036376.1 DUF116 domain-containing protein [Theionarchaea archaeon]
MQIPYAFIGKLLIFSLVFLFVTAAISLLLGFILLRKGVMILPRFVLYVIDSLYFLLKKLIRLVGLSERYVDEIGIEIRNRTYEKAFRQSAIDGRILVFPQCLRNPTCPALLTQYGVQCKMCGQCVIGNLKKRAEAEGYKVYIVPGGSFVKRIAKKDRPTGALGVACGYELNYSMMELSALCPVQGVPLLKDGCYCTKVDEELVLDKILLGTQESCHLEGEENEEEKERERGKKGGGEEEKES